MQPLHRHPHLTPSEEAILDRLARQPGKITRYLTLARAVYGVSADPDDINLVQMFTGTLRRKIEPDPRSPRFIVNYPGQGYAYYPQGYVPAGLIELMEAQHAPTPISTPRPRTRQRA